MTNARTHLGNEAVRPERIHPLSGVRKKKHSKLIDLESTFAFALFAGSLFTIRFGSYGAALFCCAAVAYSMLRPRQLSLALRRHWYLLIFPIYALLSTVWSEDPSHTLKHSLEFTLTVAAGLLLVSSPSSKSIFIGVFGAFALYTAASLLSGNMVEVGDSGVSALSGLNSSKNQQADVMANGLLITALVFGIGWRARSLVLIVSAAIVGIAQTYALFAAESVGAIAGLLFALVVFLALLGCAKSGAKSRATLMAFAGAGAVSTAAVIFLFSSDIFSWLSIVFGKDVTLTGRTYLWQKARELIFEHPLFGQGFGAFWTQENVDAEGLWRFAHITSRTGFNFHNTAYDVLIDLGWTGLLLFLFTLVSGARSTASGYSRHPTLARSYWLSAFAYLVVRMPFETIGIYEFYFTGILLFASLASNPNTATSALARRSIEESGARAVVSAPAQRPIG